jgi:hypothetical protein
MEADCGHTRPRRHTYFYHYTYAYIGRWSKVARSDVLSKDLCDVQHFTPTIMPSPKYGKLSPVVHGKSAEIHPDAMAHERHVVVLVYTYAVQHVRL